MLPSETDFETLKTCTLVSSLTEWNVGFPIQKSGFRFADWLKGTQLKLQKKLILTAIGFSSVSASCKINQFCKLFGHWMNNRLALLSRGKPQIPIRVDYSRSALSRTLKGNEGSSLVVLADSTLKGFYLQYWLSMLFLLPEYFFWTQTNENDDHSRTAI